VAASAYGAEVPPLQNWPAGHTLQSACETPPVALRYEPGAHGVILAPELEVPQTYPGAHGPLSALAASRQYEPCVQARHAVAFAAGWYEPGVQFTGAVTPARQYWPPLGAHANAGSDGATDVPAEQYMPA
jgi:hypothetical protein